MHALILEQDAFTVIMIEDVLRQLGFTSFDVACSLHEAISASARRCPDLVTSALRLGEDRGLDAVQRICAGKPIPVVYITSTAWQVREQLSDATVIQKPFRAEALQEAVARATLSA
jgi:two-component system, response regulator PdtaR